MSDETGPRDTRWFIERMPSKEVLDEVLQGDPVTRLLGIAKDRAVANIELDVLARPNADDKIVADSLKLATDTAKRIAAQGDAIKLTKKERAALDLFILLVARPAIFVQKGKVAERPANWPEVARDQDLLPRIIAGVGRIETSTRAKCGTGFIVGKRRIVTNNHVLCALFGMSLGDWKDAPKEFSKNCINKSKQWSKDVSLAPIFELRGELGSTASAQARITSVLGHHLEVDMAVLELDSSPAGSRPLPLMGAEPSSFIGRRIYAVGYPVEDSRDSLGQRITPVPVFRRVFGADDESLGTKRFSPGIILGWQETNKFKHDASTLPGSSGSCIVDFEDQRVMGLHFSGQYKMKSNYAVPLWKFRNDPVLADNGVDFS